MTAVVDLASPSAPSLTTPKAVAPPGQPDISYAPDYAKYQARAARRLQNNNLPKAVPRGLPKRLCGDLVWEGDSLAETYDWTYLLSEEQLSEIDEALSHFQSLEVPLSHVAKDTFPLPKLRPELRRLSRELHLGHGFFVIRGVDVDAHTREQNIIIYAGLSAHIAPQRARQDHASPSDGSPADVVLTHITDLRHRAGAIGSPAYTADKQVFHTDSGDVVALFALETALEGGESKLASTWRVYNELAALRPDLIHTLSQPWDVQVFAAKGKEKFIQRPLLFHQPATEDAPERVVLQYARRSLVGFGHLPRDPEIPPISEAQAEALDALHFLGERFCVNTNFEKGDMQFVNNLALFHARDGFVDGGGKHRHLARMWLRDPEYAWQTPEALGPKWKQLYEGVTREKETFPLEPFMRNAGKGR